jgi:hypothetical protein
MIGQGHPQLGLENALPPGLLHAPGHHVIQVSAQRGIAPCHLLAGPGRPSDGAALYLAHVLALIRARHRRRALPPVVIVAAVLLPLLLLGSLGPLFQPLPTLAMNVREVVETIGIVKSLPIFDAAPLLQGLEASRDLWAIAGTSRHRRAVLLLVEVVPQRRKTDLVAEEGARAPAVRCPSARGQGVEVQSNFSTKLEALDCFEKQYRH